MIIFAKTLAFAVCVFLSSLLTHPDIARSNPACEDKTLTVLGDSLVAGYGLSPGEDFPAKLDAALRERGYNLTIINAGVSGDTTSGGLSRLDWSVGPGTDFVILELGANDGLRGLDPEITRKNLDAMVVGLKERDISVLLTGMLAAPNLGQAYGNAYKAAFSNIAEKYNLAFYPFFLDGVAGNASLNQPDGIHPTSDGIRVIVENILPTVIGFLDLNCAS